MTNANETFLKVAVISGGFSHEANYSATPWIINTLESLGFQVVEIKYNDPQFIDMLLKEKVDMVFPQSLGAYGEDGTLQGILDYLDIPCVGSGLGASALCANKWLCSEFILGLATHDKHSDYSAPHGYPHSVKAPCKYRFLAEHLGVPFILKPMLGGASFGIEIIHSEANFLQVAPTLEKNFEWLLAEEFISGVEYCWGFIEDEGETIYLPASFVNNNKGMNIHSQQDKLVLPAQHKITQKEKNTVVRIGEVCTSIAAAIGLRSFVRMDMIVDEVGCIYIHDINTLPGLVPGVSMYPFMCEKVGISYSRMISMLISSAQRRQPMHMQKNLHPPALPLELQQLAERNLKKNSLKVAV